MIVGQTKRQGSQRTSQRAHGILLRVPLRIPLRPLRSKPLVKCWIACILVLVAAGSAVVLTVAQTRQRKRVLRPSTQQPAPQGSASKYSAFLHSSDKHQT